MPAPLTSQSLCGVPALVFSHATEVATAHGSVAAAARPATTGVSSAASSPAPTSSDLSRRVAGVLASTVARVLVMGPPCGPGARVHELGAFVFPRSSGGRPVVIPGDGGQ